MTLSPDVIAALAKRLDEAEQRACPITKITADHPDMDWADAYAVQDELRALKEARGVRVMGLKMGFTSLAKMEQMGVREPIHGFITDERALTGRADLAMTGLIHPKVEPEIAFLTNRDLGSPECGIEEVLAATGAIFPALEIIDSRYEGYRFDLKSVVADNTSAAGYALGGACESFADIDLKRLEVTVEKNGELVSRASGEAALGHPAQSLATLANMLARRGGFIPAGTLVLTGGLTEAVAVQSDDTIAIRFQEIGDLALRIH